MVKNFLTLHFFASLFGKTLMYHHSPCPGISWSFEGTTFPQKIFGEWRSRTFPFDYTTGCWNMTILLIKLSHWWFTP